MDAIADDGSEFVAAGVDELAVDFGAVLGAIVTEV